MGTILAAIGYTGREMYFNWPSDYPPVNASVWLWGGGGGGGGVDSRATTTTREGGNGSGGSLSYSQISLDPGDKLGIVVGQGGRGGDSSNGGALGGLGGRSLGHTVLSSLQLHTENPIQYPRVSLDGRWTNFLNTEGIWVNPDANPWTDVFQVEIPYTGFYTFRWSVDDTIIWRVDGQDINTESGGFRNIFETAVQINKGTHFIGWRALNFRGPRGFAFKIYLSSTGGRGSNAGPVPYSGAGGGGGGASVLLKNDEIIAVAAGGAGGGGRGKNDGSNRTAPNGSAGGAGISNYAGGDGQIKGGDGGGAGGGGGGRRGGNGGPVNSGDRDGQAGANGSIQVFGGFGGASTGILPGKNSLFPVVSNEYYSDWRGRGGLGSSRGFVRGQNGTNGVAYVEFEVKDQYIRHLDTWYQVKSLWYRRANVWSAPDIWVNVDGVWQFFIQPRYQPVFITTENSLNNDFSRPFGVINVQPINAGPF